ncbi:hypothetical protein ACFXB3_22710, partial [Streptomyces sp. NPDC059447]
IYQARLQARYGRAWRRKAPVEAMMPLRLARIGVPLSQTAPEGLAAAGIEPALLPAVREVVGAVQPAGELPPAALPVDDVPDLSSTGPAVPEATPSAVTGAAADTTFPSPTDGVDLVAAGWLFFTWYGRLPTVEEFGAFLARDYGLTDPETGGIIADAVLETVLAELRAKARTDAHADVDAEQPMAPRTPAPAPVGETDRAVPVAAPEPHPFFSPQNQGQVPAESQDGSGALEPVAEPAASFTETALSASAADSTPALSVEFAPSGHQALAIPESVEPQEWVADVAATGEATARMPRQQTDDVPAGDPIQHEVAQVAAWLTEAAETGTRLSGAEVARRLKVSPKTGQRRVIDATRYLEDQRKKQSRAHLRSVGN